jgi:protein ImuB
MMPWLYLHFPSLQLDALKQNAELDSDSGNDSDNAFDSDSDSERPLIIVEPRQNAVHQLNLAAQNEGITLGMGLATAISLSGELVVVEYNRALETSRLQELAQWLYQVAADIALFEPDGLALEITNMLSLYDGIDNYWQQIDTILNQQQVSYHRALAQTPLAARLLAQNQSTCTDMHQSSDAINQQLGALTIDRLELPEVQTQQLHRVGIHHLKQLWQVSGKELGRRFGLEVLSYLGKIKGQMKQPLNYYQPPAHFHQYLELFHEISQVQVLLFPLKRMVQQMSCFLLARELVVTTVTIALHYRNGGSKEYADTNLEVGSSQGEYQTDNWMTLINLRIERTQLNAPVVGITLTTGVLVEKNCTVDDLFSSSGQKGQMTPNQLISLLQAKVGKQAISGIELHPDHRPEFAFAYCSANLAPGSLSPLNQCLTNHSQSGKHQLPTKKLPKIRPLILLEQPEQLAEQCTILHGPERVRSAWWGPQSIYRDYFIARNQQGALCWLFNEPQGNWFLHGYFC